MILITAVYEGGVLKPQGPLPGLADGDRVEVVLVRAAPIDRDAPEEVVRTDRVANEIAASSKGAIEAVALPPDDDYDILEAMNANRLREGARPLIPPTEGR